MNSKRSTEKLYKLVAARRFTEARILSCDLVRANPNNPTFWRMRGDLHLKLEEWDEAIECIRRVINLMPPLSRDTLIELYRVLGSTYHKMGRMQDSINALNRVIAIAPDHADTRTLRSMAYSLLGDFERGWPDYEYRRRLEIFGAGQRKAPSWDGGSLKGKTLMVFAEQGHGDTIQFARYLSQVKAKEGNVFFAGQSLLTRLMSYSNLADHVYSDGEPVPFYDMEIPLMSLMGIFNTRLDTIPSGVPYLQPPLDAGNQAKQIISEYKNILRIGLVWKGHTQRFLNLDQFSELLAVENVKFFSLQKEGAVIEINQTSGNLIDLGSTFEDFADTAAAIQELDLVISVDTSVAHLAGALGKPVWTLLPFVPDWRWMLEREDSPWYPTMRLFRQPKLGDWASVIKRVSDELKALVGAT